MSKKKTENNKHKTKENKIIESTIPTIEKTYVYHVKVFDKEKQLKCSYDGITSKEIEKLKKTFANGEYVRYMPIGIK